MLCTEIKICVEAVLKIEVGVSFVREQFIFAVLHVNDAICDGDEITIVIKCLSFIY